MSRFSSLPAAVRWGVPPAALLTCVGLLGWSWSLPQDVEPPQATGKAAAACEALDKALPETLLGHRRDDPSPASPYTAAWDSSPRTVLTCGSDRPDYLNELGTASMPEVNDVQFGMGRDADGSYRFVTTLRDAYVEIRVPEGAYPNYADPLSSFTDAVKAAVPSWLKQ